MARVKEKLTVYQVHGEEVPGRAALKIGALVSSGYEGRAAYMRSLLRPFAVIGLCVGGLVAVSLVPWLRWPLLIAAAFSLGLWVSRQRR